MSKSLAERIGEETRNVVAEREKIRREKNKAKVLEALTTYINNQGCTGKSIFFDDNHTELDFDIYNVNCLTNADVELALKDMGFGIRSYPIGKVAVIPEQKSDIISDLLDMYTACFNKFTEGESQKATEDFKFIIKKLELGVYTVLDIDYIQFPIYLHGKSQYYRNCLTKYLQQENFQIVYFGDECIRLKISIQEKSD